MVVRVFDGGVRHVRPLFHQRRTHGTPRPGSSGGAALGLGVFSVWLMGFLSPKPAQPAYVTLTGVHMYPQDGGQLGYTNQPDPRLAQDSTARLEEHGGDEGDEPAR